MQNKSSITALMSSFGRAFHAEREKHPVFSNNLARDLMTPDDILSTKQAQISRLLSM